VLNVGDVFILERVIIRVLVFNTTFKNISDSVLSWQSVLLMEETRVPGPITTKLVNSNPAHGEVYSISYYVIKFVGHLQQVSGFLLVLWFPPPKLTHDIPEILLKVALNTTQYYYLYTTNDTF
jgi:hypothetical protein